MVATYPKSTPPLLMAWLGNLVSMSTLLQCCGLEDHRHVLCDCPAYKSDRERLMAQIQNHCPVTLPETLQSEQERDKFIEVALFGEGKQYTAKFLRKAMKHRNVILHDETIFF